MTRRIVLAATATVLCLVMALWPDHPHRCPLAYTPTTVAGCSQVTP